MSGPFDILGSLISSGTNYILGKEQIKAQQEMAAQNIALQKDFAQQGISWKVQDAKNAGIHPLAALGAQTSSFSPVSVGTVDMSNVGQDLGRAVKAMAAEQDREEQAKGEATKIALQKGKLENDILKTEVASRRARMSQESGQVGPPVPLPRSGPVRTVDGLAVSDDKVKQSEDDIPSLAKFRPGGVPLKTNPYFADAQKMEDRYGEFAGDVFGLGNLPADMIYTLGQTDAWKRFSGYYNDPFANQWHNLRGGDRSRWSRGTRNMRGR